MYRGISRWNCSSLLSVHVSKQCLLIHVVFTLSLFDCFKTSVWEEGSGEDTLLIPFHPSPSLKIKHLLFELFTKKREDECVFATEKELVSQTTEDQHQLIFNYINTRNLLIVHPLDSSSLFLYWKNLIFFFWRHLIIQLIDDCSDCDVSWVGWCHVCCWWSIHLSAFIDELE